MDGPRPKAGERAVSPAFCTLRVEVVFRELGERQLETVAAAMIERAHELANRPECECDVDVSVQSGLPGPPARPDRAGSLPASGAPTEP